MIHNNAAMLAREEAVERLARNLVTQREVGQSGSHKLQAGMQGSHFRVQHIDCFVSNPLYLRIGLSCPPFHYPLRRPCTQSRSSTSVSNMACISFASSHGASFASRHSSGRPTTSGRVATSLPARRWIARAAQGEGVYQTVILSSFCFLEPGIDWGTMRPHACICTGVGVGVGTWGRDAMGA